MVSTGCRVSLLVFLLAGCVSIAAQAPAFRELSGVIVTQKKEVVPGVVVRVRSVSGQLKLLSDEEGKFRATVPGGPLTLSVEGKYIARQEWVLDEKAATENLELEIQFVIPPVHDSVVIVASPFNPGIDRRDDAIYKSTLFSRDDQILQTLDAGINAGQHEGGGKSVEIRRFGFNLDHGGTSGGLKVLVDNVQQNQGTQGHGQGYLGQLKA